MKHRRSFMCALIAGLVVVAACSSDPPPPPEPEGPSEEELARQRADSIRQAQEEARRQAEEEARMRREEERRRAAIAEARETLEAMVFFEYDESAVTPDAARILRQKVEVLRANPGVEIRLEGHADERGSTEYNLALGQRRAESVRQFLTNFGMSADRFSTVSYGEERPLVDASNEEAWAQNRRVEFVLTAGADELSPPGNMDRQDR